MTRPGGTAVLLQGSLTALAMPFTPDGIDDAGTVTFNLAGGQGCVSSVANVTPALCRDLHRACRAKDWPRARALQHRLRPLLDALAREPGPGAVKRAMAFLDPGFSPEPRLPMVGASAGTAAAIAEALAGLGLLAGPHPDPPPVKGPPPVSTA